MSRSKKIYALLGVLAVVCLLTFAASRYEEHVEQIKNSDEIILEIPQEEVTSLSWEYDSESLAFHKDETWLYDEDEAFPVDEEKINALLDLFSEFGASFVIEEVEDYSQYGLDNPVCTIQIETETEAFEILLGDYSTMDEERYVSIGDGNAYLVSVDPMDSFEVVLSDMILDDEIPSMSDVSEIQFAGVENYTVVYEEDSANTYCADDVYFTEKNGVYVPLDTTNVSAYLQTLRYLNLGDYTSYNATDEELAACGLDNPELTITVQYTVSDEESGEDTTETFTMSISRDSEERAAEESAGTADDEDASAEETEASDGVAYARIGDSGIIYTISSDDFETLRDISYNTLRHQEVLSASFDDIYQVDIQLEDTDYTLTSEETDDGTVWYYQGNEVEISDFSSALAALTADSFTDETPDQKTEISLTVYLDNENYPEITVTLYRYDGSCCLTVVDGEPVCFVERSLVVDLIETINAIVL